MCPHRTWVSDGRIQFTDVAIRYHDGMPFALKYLNLDVLPGKRVGIVGRTGAGKSSLMKSLLRTVELNTGKILIDGIDISRLSLHALRSNVTFIPQTPFLFEGTIRENLDPLYSTDLEMLRALEEVELADLVSR